MPQTEEAIQQPTQRSPHYFCDKQDGFGKSRPRKSHQELAEKKRFSPKNGVETHILLMCLQLVGRH
ncbi:MAG: hypothetical protein Ct9H90mP27_6660 [Gammaproteobacteria bacterium]|nr:MAG: hypothetical protein Ct9H90mP27_6660 [Gammaproteobacteria bacterium]